MYFGIHQIIWILFESQRFAIHTRLLWPARWLHRKFRVITIAHEICAYSVHLFHIPYFESTFVWQLFDTMMTWVWVDCLQIDSEGYHKVWSVEKETKENPWLLMVKHSEIILFFHLHIPLLCGWWDHQRILKK